ncbi:repetin-like [Moschus berezovskii]|uniref:repetin-like n=1 Tax=Moschus berezovskii TaxID=68408 RepID=UPI0024451F27|nr:repetin-like [Moschus berezovskii]
MGTVVRGLCAVCVCCTPIPGGDRKIIALEGGVVSMAVMPGSEEDGEVTLPDAGTVVGKGTAVAGMGCTVRTEKAAGVPDEGPGKTAAGAPDGGPGKTAAGAPDEGPGKTGARGRRQPEPQMGARGRRQPEPQVGARGRRQPEPQMGARGRRQPEPQTGARGRRQPEPQTGARGRRQPQMGPRWGPPGRDSRSPR